MAPKRASENRDTSYTTENDIAALLNIWRHEPGRETPGASEFSHGPGLRPKHLENAAPCDGGRYKGKSPGRH